MPGPTAPIYKIIFYSSKSYSCDCRGSTQLFYLQLVSIWPIMWLKCHNSKFGTLFIGYYCVYCFFVGGNHVILFEYLTTLSTHSFYILWGSYYGNMSTVFSVNSHYVDMSSECELTLNQDKVDTRTDTQLWTKQIKCNQATRLICSTCSTSF
jgi:hypothetical protein